MSADGRRRYKVLMLTSTFPRWEGDTEPRFILDLARRLGRDYEIRVLAPHAPGALPEEELEGVKVRRFRYWVVHWQGIAYQGGIVARLRQNPVRLFQLPLFLFSETLAVARLLKTWRPDLIHAHWLIPQGTVAVLARWLTRCEAPLLCTSHGGDLFSLRAAPFRWLKRKVIRAATGVTVVSRAMATEVANLAGDVRVDVIPMGTDLSHLFVPAPARVSGGDAQRIVFVGRLVQKKGVSVLLNALKILRQRFPSASLTIAGDGPLRHSLEREAASLGLRECVSFLGTIPHKDMAALYHGAALAVFPFVVASDGDQEGLGLVMVEAMGCGCPVIASDLPAVRDVVADGQTGLLVPAGDVNALAEAVGDMLSNREETQLMALRAREQVLGRFDWDMIANAYGARYFEMTNGTTHGACRTSGQA